MPWWIFVDVNEEDQSNHIYFMPCGYCWAIKCGNRIRWQYTWTLWLAFTYVEHVEHTECEYITLQVHNPIHIHIFLSDFKQVVTHVKRGINCISISKEKKNRVKPENQGTTAFARTHGGWRSWAVERGPQCTLFWFSFSSLSFDVWKKNIFAVKRYDIIYLCFFFSSLHSFFVKMAASSNVCELDGRHGKCIRISREIISGCFMIMAMLRRCGECLGCCCGTCASSI